MIEFNNKKDPDLDRILLGYYKENFAPSAYINSLGKDILMNKLRQQTIYKKNIWSLLLTTATAALLVGVSTFVISEFTMESNIDNKVEIRD